MPKDDKPQGMAGKRGAARQEEGRQEDREEDGEEALAVSRRPAADASAIRCHPVAFDSASAR